MKTSSRGQQPPDAGMNGQIEDIDLGDGYNIHNFLYHQGMRASRIREIYRLCFNNIIPQPTPFIFGDEVDRDRHALRRFRNALTVDLVPNVQYAYQQCGLRDDGQGMTPEELQQKVAEFQLNTSSETSEEANNIRDTEEALAEKQDSEEEREDDDEEDEDDDGDDDDDGNEEEEEDVGEEEEEEEEEINAPQGSEKAEIGTCRDLCIMGDYDYSEDTDSKRPKIFSRRIAIKKTQPPPAESYTRIMTKSLKSVNHKPPPIINRPPQQRRLVSKGNNNPSSYSASVPQYPKASQYAPPLKFNNRGARAAVTVLTQTPLSVRHNSQSVADNPKLEIPPYTKATMPRTSHGRSQRPFSIPGTRITPAPLTDAPVRRWR